MEPQPGCSKDFVHQEEDKKKFKSEAAVENEEKNSFSILDLSDDVLLIILKHCTPRDLKALGFSCLRLGQLVCDRSLWGRVDARDYGVGRAQLRWYLEHTIKKHTTSLCLRGFAEEAKGCLGTVDAPRPILDPPSDPDSPEEPAADDPPAADTAPAPDTPPALEAPPAAGPSRQHYFHIHRANNPQLPRFSISPMWRDNDDTGSADGSLQNTDGCGGPKWTLGRHTLSELHTLCPDLTELRLEYVNINCSVTPLYMFPPTLRVLSMRGSRCYNLEINKSFLFRIHEFMPQLELVDLGECGWMEPATLMPLSKLAELRTLLLDHCRRLSECVAYASLAARYGFRKLKVLNLMGTPMGDSEVSGFGWLPLLEELHLSPSQPHRAVEHHSHYLDDPREPLSEMEPWEHEEPDYFRSDSKPCQPPNPFPEPEPALAAEAARELLLARAGEPGGARRLAVVHYRRYNHSNRDQRHYEFLQEGRRQRNFDFVRELENYRRQLAIALPDAPPAAPQASKRVKRSVSDSARPVTRSKTQQETTDQAGPSASTRSKCSVDVPSTSAGTKRSLPKSKDGPASKKKCVSATKRGVVKMKVPQRNQRRRNADQRNPEDNLTGAERQERLYRRIDEVRRRLNRLRQDRNDERQELRQNANQGVVFEDLYNNEGRVHVIYVNVRRPRHEMFRMLVQEEEPRMIGNNRHEYERAVLNVVEVPRRENPDERPEPLRNGPEYDIIPDPVREGMNRDHVMNILRMPFIQNFLYGPGGGGHVSGASLITDSAINRFGRADDPDVVNYVHIGPNGEMRAGLPPPNASDRPNKSKLKVLVVRGFTGITNRTLDHLVTAAPDLKYLDVTGTSITEDEVNAFRNLRPDCEVKYLY